MFRTLISKIKQLPLGLSRSRSLFIQTESTPNEHSLKFKPGMAVTGTNRIIEYLEPKTARKGSELASELFQIEGVRAIMFGNDFITVTKAADMEWPHLKPAVFATLMDYLSRGRPLFRESETVQAEEEAQGERERVVKTRYGADAETVLMIMEILDTRVRPAVQDDGGDVQFVDFKEGVVELQLRGACRSCSSSVITLKNGIENLLMHYVPEVTEVRQVEDEAERASEEYFNKIESQKRDSDDRDK